MDNLISVIVPCYNQSEYLNEALYSLLNQTYSNWECIIVNDGSTDDTENIALSFCKKDKRFRYYLKTNGGLSSARNFGLKFAEGEFIQFLDCDDLLPPNKLITHLNFIKSQHCDIVFGRNKRFYNDDLSTSEYAILSFSIDINKLENIIPRILAENMFVVHSAFIKREVTNIVGQFNESLKGMEDWEYWIRAAFNGLDFKYCSNPEGDVLYRIKDVSMSTNRWNMNFSQFKIYTSFYGLSELSEVNEFLKSRIKYLRRDLLFILAKSKKIMEKRLEWKNVETSNWWMFILCSNITLNIVALIYYYTEVIKFRIKNIYK